MISLDLHVQPISTGGGAPPYLSPNGWDALPHPPLDEAGYAVEEFRVSGTARLYRNARGSLGASEPYATRILAIHPRNDANFSGVVHIELFNPSTGSDFPMFWPDAGYHLMERGDAYLGITCKSVTIADLRQRDPERYASLSFPHDSAIWDMLGAVAATTHLPAAGGLLPGLRTPSRRFATGWSQSGSFLRTYLSERLHEQHSAALGKSAPAGPSGAPIIDGYLIGVSSGGFGPMGYVELERDGEMSLDESFAPAGALAGVVPIDDRRRTITRPPVPVIEYHSEDEAQHHLWHARPDSDLPGDSYRCYPVPGRGHEPGLLPTAARRSEQGLGDVPDTELNADDSPRNEGSKWLIATTVSHLVAWSDGVAPPRADPIPFEVPLGFARDPEGVDYSGIEPVRDNDGHAIGGLRSLEIDLPLAFMRVVPSERHIMPAWEHVPFTRAEADARYGGPDGYRNSARRRAAELVDTGWLLPEHAELAVLSACARYPENDDLN
ncbi:alpha/beta hydrolase domain-containing protein [Leucobacter sp. USHLN154]|uniref:alpha/beta hydrolase domain-containing protein n=1 Tax=Leucobacter sp. USHLN154 TaxID=3081269 RepID=UPI00301A0852